MKNTIRQLYLRMIDAIATPRMHKRERGDVPGWVMITLMTAALVVMLWAIVGPALTNLFEEAISRVTDIS
ncbi:hypothetical protein EBF03_06015 [Arcanobacterium haemolyticum]|uniref:Uncharacterized protein n=1 Tax=Arcanobacterium haemolyticum (strain ATCC 9345 / DSM 20595 / CCM 5947 / CCUG 17215 / LMG 16163 / NBRC 15585 / NCTC 8452 / 11018) TaxID=644284 RepID=D7BJV0_ARCHD|nr:hypothetical protein [Arcanobacterium haemolyticum]ADH92930.1 conserved hypothetical protein [Arcanobacterium haemolyticum DSM 20595]QCX47008.1 hypothetical protein EBF03_06015 [Arcanobacterium haemolyticum]SQH28314.1 Uncharacterised protein [Arcanobacterium haemolyticum]